MGDEEKADLPKRQTPVIIIFIWQWQSDSDCTVCVYKWHINSKLIK